MATWHQNKAPVRLDHATQWSVVIDPPHMCRAIYCTESRELAEVYRRNLQANNPHAHAYSYILPPRTKG